MWYVTCTDTQAEFGEIWKVSLGAGPALTLELSGSQHSLSDPWPSPLTLVVATTKTTFISHQNTLLVGAWHHPSDWLVLLPPCPPPTLRAGLWASHSMLQQAEPRGHTLPSECPTPLWWLFTKLIHQLPINLNTFKRVQIIPSTFSGHNRIKLDHNNSMQLSNRSL